MDRHEALARVRRVRDWSGMVGARRLSHALDALVLASGLVGGGVKAAPDIAGWDSAEALHRLRTAGPVLCTAVSGLARSTAEAALQWALEELSKVAGVHAAKVGSPELPGEASK